MFTRKFVTQQCLLCFQRQNQKYSQIISQNLLKFPKETNHLKLNIPSIRYYAKGKDKGKDKKGKTKVSINESELSEIINLDNFKNRMLKEIDQLKSDFVKHLSIRSSAGSIEALPISIDGEEHTLQEVAQIIRKNPKTIVINMSVFPQAIPEALKALDKSGMNLNPQQEGTTIYVPIPKITKEHRENLSKNAKTIFVKCKNNLREVQLRETKSLKKKTGLSEDLVRNVELQLKTLADNFINEAEKILESKQKELLG